MRQATVLLRLEGPLQSWGVSTLWQERPTTNEPTKSGVVGLIGAALGVERGGDRLRELGRDLAMAVRVDLPGHRMVDYHTVGGGGTGVPTAQRRRDGTPVPKVTVSTGELEIDVSERGYLSDASFLVALTGPAPLIEEIDAALRMPHWRLYLGRACCIPSVPVAAGVVELDDPVEALRQAPAHPRTTPGARLRVVRECAPEEGARRMDVPRDPRRRTFSARWVAEEHIVLPQAQAGPTAGEIDTMDG